MRQALAGLGVAGAIALSADAQAQLALVPTGQPFFVNAMVEEDQDSPEVACATTGVCTIAWRNDLPSGVRARSFAADGTLIGSEILVTDDNLDDPGLASTGSGAFFVAWSGRRESTEFQIFGRAYDAEATPSGSPFRISDPAPNPQADQAVACNPAGECAVVWDEVGAAVWARTYAASGAPRGPQVMVAPLVAPQGFPRVAISDTGDFVVVWHHFASNLEDSAVMARSYTGPAAEPNGPPYVVAFTRNKFGNPFGLGIGVDANGSFVVVWDSQLNADTSLNFEPRPGEVWAQRLGGIGALVGDPILVAAINPELRQIHSRVAKDRAGSFVVVWEVNEINGPGERIVAQLYDTDGVSQGALVQVNNEDTDRHRTPSVAADAGGNHLIAWQSVDRTSRGQVSRGVLARRFAVVATPATPAPTPSATVPPVFDGVADDGCTMSAAVSSRGWLLIVFPLISTGFRWLRRCA